MNTPRTQKRSDGTWTNESGISIPYNRTTKLERIIESGFGKVLKKAVHANKYLTELKEDLRKLCDEIYIEAMVENDSKSELKGNFTKYNFDRSIKVEVDIQDRIEFDDLTIEACKQKFDEFLSDKVTAKNEFIKELVLDAFSTRTNKLDVKKVMSLFRYESKIKDPRFQEALALLKKSIRRPSSKSYYRISVRNESGGYDAVKLNFSSI